MAIYDVVLQAKYDTTASTVTITGMAPPPPPPADFPYSTEFWHGQTGPGFTFTVPVQKRDQTPNPTAIYEVPGTEPVQRFQVQYANGAWQMPGTAYTGE